MRSTRGRLLRRGRLSRRLGCESGAAAATQLDRNRFVAGHQPFAAIHQKHQQISITDRALPLSERHGASMLLAIRPWEPRAFRALRRKDRDPVPAGRLLNPMLDAAPPRAPEPKPGPRRK